jgi:penicillin-binding protein 1A
VYRDKSLGISQGPFPKPGVKITREYQCVSPRFSRDTSFVDSLIIDTIGIPTDIADSVKGATAIPKQTISPKLPENRTNPVPENKTPASPKSEPSTEVNKTRKEIRDERKQNKNKAVN